MSLLLALALAAAVAWYLQERQRSGAGASAAARARRLRSPLVRLATLAGIQTARGRRADQWAAGAAGERQTAARLAPLARQGWTVLHDRALPGSRANVDHVTISPAGVVVVVDSKRWSARYPLRVTGGRLLHGQHDVTDRLRGIRHEAQTVSRLLDCPVIPLVSMDGPAVPAAGLVLDGIRIVPADQLVPALRRIARRHRAVGDHPAARAARVLKPYGRN
ncbi:nuclease-related domain-containing protein [Streptomyces roseolus]|uniref:nuclease-related domain-containing protein n=1 Tax=Streptomyces roseolus TaxID=67358 RepID=UPI0037BA95EE